MVSYSCSPKKRQSMPHSAEEIGEPQSGSRSASMDPYSPTELANIYRDASTFFLTRRLYEAFSTLEPLFPSTPIHQEVKSKNDVPGDGSLASAPKSLRVKLWSLHVALLDAIMNLGPDEGSAVFGRQQWRTLASRVRDGDIWDQVVCSGYCGIEENVDREVVVNLATLSLAHASSQALNQQRLEKYLAASAPTGPQSRDPAKVKGMLTEANVTDQASGSDSSMANTSAKLSSWLTLLEIYALHVLPQNGEWVRARDFISHHEILDIETQRSFLEILQSLEDDKNRKAMAEVEGRRQKSLFSKAERQPGTSPVEKDLSLTHSGALNAGSHDLRNKKTAGRVDDGKEAQPRALADSASALLKSAAGASQARKARGSQTSRKQDTTQVYPRPLAIINTLKKYLLFFRQAFASNHFSLFRTLIFIMSIVLALGKSEVRERLRMATGVGWDKIRATVGMGVKVSYI